MLHRGVSTVQVAPRIVRNRDERLFIGTLGVNCLEYTRRCIDTVKTTCNAVRFVYIDNGSNAENVGLLRTWRKRNGHIDDFLLGFNGRNAGVSVGWNQLIKMAIKWDATKILICNNDIAFGPKTIDGMIEAFAKLKAEYPETVMVTAANATKSPAALAEIPQKWEYAEHPDFSCFMIEPEFLSKIGMFSEEYKPAFFEDNDCHWRILLMGYKAFSTNWAPYSHIASRTRHGNPDLVPHATFRENKIRFYKKMLTRTVDQKIADERYALWKEHHPELVAKHVHPEWKEVISFADAKGLISDDLKKWLNDLNVRNCPNES